MLSVVKAIKHKKAQLNSKPTQGSYDDQKLSSVLKKNVS